MRGYGALELGPPLAQESRPQSPVREEDGGVSRLFHEMPSIESRSRFLYCDMKSKTSVNE